MSNQTEEQVGARVRVIPARNTRKIARRGKASQTPGKLKGEWCQTNPTKKFYACNPKAVKDSRYPEWHAKFKSAKGNGGTA